MAHAHRRGAILVPTLSRLVVGVLFVLMGTQACFQDVTLTPSQESTLQEHGILPPSADVASDDAETSDPVVRGVHVIAVHLASMGLADSMTLPWVIAIVEFTAGALLLVGLFVRLWAVVLTVLSLWWMVAMGFIEAGLDSISPLEWASHPLGLMTVIAFAGSAILSMGLIAVGGGPLSLDRGLFGSPSDPPQPPLVAGNASDDDSH